jgi:hypothetical protein
MGNLINVLSADMCCVTTSRQCEAVWRPARTCHKCRSCDGQITQVERVFTRGHTHCRLPAAALQVGVACVKVHCNAVAACKGLAAAAGKPASMHLWTKI